MAQISPAVPEQQGLEPCRFPQLNKAFTAPDTRLSSCENITPETSADLQSFCADRSVSLETVLQATWALVLRSYVGSDATLFGYRGATGSFILCANQFNLNDEIEKHLQRTLETSQVATSIASCWDVVERDGDSLGQGLFNSVVVFSDGELDTRPSTKYYPLQIGFQSADGAISIKVEHDCSLFDAAQGQRVARTIRNMLFRLIRNPSQTIGDLETIDEDDLRQIWDWNSMIPEDPKLCAHHLFERQARRTPDAQAIKSWDGNMNFVELEKLTSTLGGFLSAKGVRPDMIIPICFEKCKWTIVAMMAVLKAGAAFTTLDPIQPTNRLCDTIEETRSKIVLVSASQAERFADQDWDIISNIPELAQQPTPPAYSTASLAVQPSDMSYVAFTSGSTGKPKGVAHQHLASCSSITLKSRDGADSGYGPGKRIMQFASQAFAASVVEILKTLGNGGCICIPSAEVRLNNIPEFMKENGITRVFLTPALLKLFKPEDFPTLEILLVGGEPVLQSLIDIWAGEVKLVEAIGMTEGVAIQTNIKNTGHMTRICQTLSGVPWIVDPDDHNKLAPIGALGELMVEGPCLAKGYLHDDEKTKVSFIEAPLWARKAEYPNRKFRLYRTGDMARYFSDGVVKLLGRRDNRVKLNGQRIELGEVEHHMQKNLPASMAVAANVVTVNHGCKDRSFLVGIIFKTTELGRAGDPEDGLVPRSDCDDILSLLPELKGKMAIALPAYMVPTVFLPFNRRPTNVSGKLDRKKLHQIAVGLSSEQILAYNKTDMQKTPPSTDMEKKVLGLWAQLFNVEADSIGIEDSFLVYGGDSLQAIILVRIARSIGVLLTTSDILQNPILRSMSLTAKPLANGIALAKPSEARRTQISSEDAVRIRQDIGEYEIESMSRATDWQAWAVYAGLLKTRGWTDYLVFNLRGSLDIARLEAACKSLVAHSPILRTVFTVDRRRVIQVVLKDYPFEFKKHEIAGGENIETVSKYIFDEDKSSCSMLGEPLVRFALVVGPESNKLLWRISHAQYDVVSLLSLLRALKSEYLGVDIPFSPTFIDFVNFTNENVSVSEPFWRDLLKGSEMTRILHQPKPSHKSIVNTALKQKIALPSMQSHGITTASLVLSGWAIVLSELSGSTDVVFGRLTSGRHTPMEGIEDVVGPCMNITPVRAHTKTSARTLSFLQAVQAQHLASLEFENVGFRHIIEQCTNWAPWTRFSSIVNHVHIEEGIEDLFALTDDLKYDFEVYEPMHDKADLWLQTKPMGDQMEVELRFCGEAISKELAEKALQLFCDIVQGASAAVEKPLSSLLEASSFTDAQKSPSASSILVDAAWKQVFGIEVEIKEDIPFYTVWGDLLGAAALVKIYRKAGFEVSVEDIIERATMREQIDMLEERLL